MVIWTETASTDMENIQKNADIRIQNSTKTYLKNLTIYVQLLVNMPFLGVHLKHFSSKYKINLFQLIFRNHKIIYSFDGNNIHIITVVHYKQNLSLKLNSFFNY